MQPEASGRARHARFDFARVGDHEAVQARRVRRIVLVVLLASCTTKRAEPELVTPPAAAEPARLAYSVDAFAGNWKIEAHFKSRPGSPSVDITAELAMRFATASPEALDVYLERLALHGTADGKSIDVTMAASDPRFAELMTPPLHRIAMRADGPGEATSNVDNPIARQGGNLIKSTVFLIPSLPNVPAGPGTKWFANRVVPKSNNAGPELKADIRYELVRFEPCGKARCAVLASTADTGERETEVGDAVARVRYTLDGTSQIQLDGALVKAEAKMTMLLKSDAVSFESDGTLTCWRL